MAVREIAGHERLVPVDLIVRANADVMISGRKFPRQVHDHRLVLPRWEPNVSDRLLPSAPRIAHLERWRCYFDRGLLPERDVDAGVGRIDPAAQEEKAVGAARGV